MRKWQSLWLLLLLSSTLVTHEHVHAFASVLHKRNTNFSTRIQSSYPVFSLLACAASSSLPFALDRSGGFLYRKGVFHPDEYKIIADEVSAWTTKLQEETCTSVAKNRLGVALPRDTSPTVQLLKDPTNSLTLLVQKLTDQTYHISPHIPVEIRSYEKSGACMAWHVDDILCDPPQMEIVLTLENTSDCATLWKTASGSTSGTGEGTRTHRQETDPNSGLLLRAGQTPHCVTSLRRGRRIILKCAFATTHAIYNDSTLNDNQQFGIVRSAKARSKRRVHRKKRG